MDVLRYWSPDLDLSGFSKGEISEKVWEEFIRFIHLCHAFKHWQRLPLHRAVDTVGRKQSVHEKREAKNEATRINQMNENHKLRAAFLAAEKIHDIDELVGDHLNSNDHLLVGALFEAFPNIRDGMGGHEHADFSICAFDSFDAHSEIQGEPSEIATRWKDRSRE